MVEATVERSRMEEKYLTEVRPALKEKLGRKSIMEVPRLVKIVVNMGIGEAVSDIKNLDHAVEDLRAITGQQPKITRATRSEANFKLRKGMPIGAKVTLRGRRMYEFLDRLISCALPRVRDFRGIPRKKGFDGRGNYTLGIQEQIIFPEIDFDKIDKVRGMDISFVTTAETDDEARELLSHLGLPFRKR
ncbi:MAG: 50S ribosomal protein L5 [Candidatus Hydrogenedentota bacterium]|nr:MAG: 50S ribosomal protein L5 [Candidatus Hydrogenedentota bacterium]